MPDLTSLNEEQYQAVTHGSGPLLIIAGAGTGKTTVVTKRIEHLIIDKKIPPSNILALTFTEKAAQEMETRIDEILPYGYTTLWIETFHAFCDRILRQEAINIGLNPRFDLLTEAESLLFLRKHLFDFQLDYYRPLGNPMKFLQGMLSHFSRLRDDDISPQQYLKYAKGIQIPNNDIPKKISKKDSMNITEDEVKKTLELANSFKTYEELKAKEGVMDYSDLISNTLKLFRERPHILKQYQKQFQYIFVDEFQDTNYAQNELAILLSGEKKNITVVGDDDQCLPGDTLISMPQGVKQIQNCKKGDTVLTAVGNGAIGISTITNVSKNVKNTTLVTLTTKTGATITATANHKMFCYVPADENRDNDKQVIINFYQCYNNTTKIKKNRNTILTNPAVSHLVEFKTNNDEVINKLLVKNIPFTTNKKGVHVQYSLTDIKKAYDFAEQLANITGGTIEMKSMIGTFNQNIKPSVILPADNLLEGSYVPIIKNNIINYDEIISLKRTSRSETVYDLEIDKTHNFIANNIVVHNSIYRWRGAAVANMMQFTKHFPKAKIVTLTKNYRSTQNILDDAYQLIQNNNPDRLEVKEKIDKKLFAMREIKGDEIELLFTNRGEEEADAVAKKIQEEVKKTNRPYNDFAILVRANDHSIPFQRSLERLHIPYQFLGPGHLFQQNEIKDLVAYLHVLTNFDDMASLYRIITMPVFTVQARDVASLLNFAKQTNTSLFEAMENVSNSSLTEEGKEKIVRITKMIKQHLEKVPKEEAGQILYYFFEDSGLLGLYLDPGSIRTEKEAQNIAKFFEKLQSFAANHKDASVFAVVDWLDLAMELGESPQAADIDWTRSNAVNILTIHASKGLEFPVVFVVNLVSQRFPSRDRKEQIPVPNDLIRETLPEGDEGLQEERRLFYVAITRAKDKLFLTASRFYNEGKRERKISPFVPESLGEQLVLDAIKKQTAKPPGQQLSLLEVLNSNILKNEEKNITSDTDKVALTPLTYISYSQIQTFRVCPLHYKLKYIMHLPTPPSPALSYGVSVHSTLRDFFMLYEQKQDVKNEIILELLKKNWIKQGYSSKTHEQQTYKQAENMLISIAKETLINLPDTIAVELPFNFWLGKLKVGGRIDRIDKLKDGRIEIIDYKTGKNIPTDKKVREDLQLSFYALAATEIKDGILGKSPDDIILTLDYLEEEKRISTTRSKADLEQAKEDILKVVEDIKSSDFLCNHSMLCNNCEYQMLCQANRN